VAAAGAVVLTLLLLVGLIPPRGGQIHVESNPDSAICLLDGQFVGTTTCDIENVSAGFHTITVIKDGQEEKQTVTVEPGGKHQVVVHIRSLLDKATKGSIDIQSEPSGAQCYIDNGYQGVTRKIIDEIEQGNHTIILRKTGYEDGIQIVAVEAGGKHQVMIHLKALPPPQTIPPTIVRDPRPPERPGLRISDDAAKDFVRKYLSLMCSGNIAELMNCYAERVSFLNAGVRDKGFIRKDKQDYYRRWPIVQRSILGDIQVEDGSESGTKRVSFHTSFSVRSPARGASISGTTVNTLILSMIDGSLRIIDEREEVESREQRN
jgi:hypothetical protein